MSLAIALVVAVLFDVVLVVCLALRQARSGHHLNDSLEVRCRRLHKEVMRLQADKADLAGRLEATSSRLDGLVEDHESALSESLSEVMAFLDLSGYERLPRGVADRARALVRPLSTEKVARLLFPPEAETRVGPVPIEQVIGAGERKP